VKNYTSYKEYEYIILTQTHKSLSVCVGTSLAITVTL